MPRHNTSFLKGNWRVSCLQRFRFLRSAAQASCNFPYHLRLKYKKREKLLSYERDERDVILNFDQWQVLLQLAKVYGERISFRGPSDVAAPLFLSSPSAHIHRKHTVEKTRDCLFSHDVARRCNEREQCHHQQSSLIHCAATRVLAAEAGEVQFSFFKSFRPKLRHHEAADI